jgi:ribulose-5-phosphate 4-epimerase/fuculose-1-phosphate aldolase
MVSDISLYPARLCRNNLASDGDMLWAMTEPGKKKGVWNRSHADCTRLDPLLETIADAAIVYARPAQPYAAIMDYLARTAKNNVICPKDSETRVVLTDLPVAGSLDTEQLLALFSRRRCVVIPERGIIALGSGIAEACVIFAAACFAGFVKFFTDVLAVSRRTDPEAELVSTFELACQNLPPAAVFEGGLMAGPFESEADVYAAIRQAGSAITDQKLVDASFGNISYKIGDTLYITTSGSFLDDLEKDIAAVNLKTGSHTGGKPSSELPAHKRIAETTQFKAVLHGHPLFSVILSMDCHEVDCPDAGDCNRFCPRFRQVCGVPVVAGETGGGPYGLDRTVPPAVAAHKAAIVYGHGVFSCADMDFNNALGRMVTLEQICRKTYFQQMGISIKGLL